MLMLGARETWLGSDIANIPKSSPRSVRLRRLARRLSESPRSECRRSSPCRRSSFRKPKMSPNSTSRRKEQDVYQRTSVPSLWKRPQTHTADKAGCSIPLQIKVGDGRTKVLRYRIGGGDHGSQLTLSPMEMGPPSRTSANAPPPQRSRIAF